MKGRDWLHGLVVGIVYTIVAVVMTWPVAGRLTEAVAGTGGDPWQTMWRFETKHSLVDFSNPNFQFSNVIIEEFLGGGEPRLVNLSVWPWMGLQVFWGQPTAYNVIWLLSFILAGTGMYALVRYLVGQFGKGGNRLQWSVAGWSVDPAALVAGVYFMFLPYHVAHAMGHFGAMQIQWLPWIILAGSAWVVRPRAWKAAALGGLLVAQAWTEHHYMLWLGIFGILAGGYWWKYRRSQGREMVRDKDRRRIWWSVLVFAGALVVIIASYWPTIRFAWQADSPLALGQEQTIRFSADLFAFITPSPWHTVWGSLAGAVFSDHYTGNLFESTQFLGWLPLLLVLFFHQLIPKWSKQFWLVVALVFGVISLGPRLHVLGEVLSIPLPYALIDSWPVLSAVRAVGRAGVMVGLAMAVLLGWVLATQLKRRSAGAVVAIIILGEFLLAPVPMQSTELLPVYDEVKNAPGEQLLELPAATNYTLASRSLYASHIHGKEVLGNIALERAATEGDYALAKRLPAVKQLLYLRTTDMRENRREFWGQNLQETLPDALEWADVAGVLVHPDSLSSLQSSTVTRFLSEAGMMGEQDGDVVWYARADAEWAAEGDGIVVMRGEGFSHVDYDPEEDLTYVRVPKNGKALFVNTEDEVRPVEVRLRVATENRGAAEVWFADKLVGRLGVGDVTYRNFSVVVPPGQHSMDLRVEGEEPLLLLEPRFEVVSK